MKLNRFPLMLTIVGIMTIIILGPLLIHQSFGRTKQAVNRRLIAAILQNNRVAARSALKAGADPNAEMDGWAWTDFVHPLTNALSGNRNGHLRDTPLLLTMDSLVKRGLQAARDNGIPLENVDTVRTLVEAGADIDAQNQIGATPLFMAVEWGYYDTAHYLVAHRANPNVAAMGGMTALHFAASGGDPRLVKALLDHGADPNVKDILGATPLFAAALPPETPQQVAIAKLLLQYHADTQIKDSTGAHGPRACGTRRSKRYSKSTQASRRKITRPIPVAVRIANVSNL